HRRSGAGHSELVWNRPDRPGGRHPAQAEPRLSCRSETTPVPKDPPWGYGGFFLSLELPPPYFVVRSWRNDSTFVLSMSAVPVSTNVGTGAKVSFDQSPSRRPAWLWCRSSSMCNPTFAIVYGFCTMVAAITPF